MYKVGVIGAAGYSGIELLRILNKHKNVEITVITSNTFKEKKLEEVYPEFKNVLDLTFEEFNIDKIINRVEIVFFALPAQASMETANQFIKYGKMVIDLSGAFRLQNIKQYPDWYNFTHKYPELVTQAQYGLSELFREKISGTRFVANPGCYPTGTILGLAPALEHKLIQTEDILVDAKSGVSGKGRSLNLSNLYYESNENMYAYKIGNHQHVPEIEQAITQLSGELNSSIVFVPQVVPMDRGILANSYSILKKDITIEAVLEIYKEFYKNEFFVRVMDKGQSPTTKVVQNTNFCDIGVSVVGKRLVVTTAIDNLVKGAAGQAVQNFNIMTAQSEEEGLL